MSISYVSVFKSNFNRTQTRMNEKQIKLLVMLLNFHLHFTLNKQIFCFNFYYVKITLGNKQIFCFSFYSIKIILEKCTCKMPVVDAG